MLKRACISSIFILIILFSFFQVSMAISYNIYLNGDNVSKDFSPIEQNGQVMVKARSLAKSIEAKIIWMKSIKTLVIEKEDQKIKMMVGSPYLQLGNKAIKADSQMLIKDGHTYLPLKDVVKAFNYMVDYEQNGHSIYIFKPESSIKDVKWRNDEQEIVIDMDKISPYRIKKTDDPCKLILEIDKAALAPGFTDQISDGNYYLEVNKIENKAGIQLVITSKFPIPFQMDGGIKEEDNNIVLEFLPNLTGISWSDNSLEIKSNGKIEKPKISYLDNPRRLVIDIPSLIISEIEPDIDKNPWIKDIRISQFKYDPVILRVVVELKENKSLDLVESDNDKSLVLRPAIETKVSNLEFKNNTISFISNNPIKPDLFTLENPARLVIDLHNTIRSEKLPEQLKIDNGIVKQIRASRFDDGIVRIVADLKELRGYVWKQTSVSKNQYKHTILLKNGLNQIKIKDKPFYTNINIDLNGKVKYEVKKFSYPDRLVVDIKGIEYDPNKMTIPDPTGIIKKIRVGGYSDQGIDVTRVVFELNKFISFDVTSSNPDKIINISLPKEKKQEKSNLIIIDAGHGGFDPGAIGASGLMEKDVTLDIAKKVKEHLKEQNYSVLLTRDKDEFISLKKRVDIANNAQAKIFISIHCNSSIKDYAKGTETFMAPDKEGESLPLAKLLQSELISELNHLDRGIKSENFYVIKNTDMPAVLLEVAFISNPHEESLLDNSIFRDRVASAITKGITSYMVK